MAKKESHPTIAEALKQEQQLQSLPRMERLKRLAAEQKKEKRRKRFWLVSVSLIACALIINYMLYSYDPEKERLEAQRIAAENEKAVALAMASTIETDEDNIKKQFSAWDGSHRDLVRRTKRLMNDPDSFEHVRTTYTRKDGYLMVIMKYRGTNGFGAKILDTAIAFYSIDGEYQGQITQ